MSSRCGPTAVTAVACSRAADFCSSSRKDRRNVRRRPLCRHSRLIHQLQRVLGIGQCLMQAIGGFGQIVQRGGPAHYQRRTGLHQLVVPVQHLLRFHPAFPLPAQQAIAVPQGRLVALQRL